ncbi:YybH family protein [Aestuariivivens marinum]|uniref:YybH family protein n=1 Tax=Aestuariivivens marinum TaxID=2913555 RepID=UPI001F5A27D3|nr:DUF4440 domain-containing protein [Aestuariivivens marinum]
MKTLNNFIIFTTLLLLCITIVTGCKNQTEETKEVTPEPTFDLTIAKAEIVAANKTFADLFVAKDSAGIANLYTQDAKFMMNGSPAIVGREHIQSVISSIINSGVSSVDLITLDVWGTEDLVTEEGELALYVGENKVDEGKYLVLWKKVDGKWYLFRDIFNSNLPPAQSD